MKGVGFHGRNYKKERIMKIEPKYDKNGMYRDLYGTLKEAEKAIKIEVPEKVKWNHCKLPPELVVQNKIIDCLNKIVERLDENS
jgi:hypothetical protein